MLRIITLIVCIACVTICNATGRFISFQEEGRGVCITGGNKQISVGRNDFKGILIAVESLRADLNAVCGNADVPIVIGSVERGSDVPKDIMAKLAGKTEQFIITMRKGKVYICGSDMRGTIYGIYEFSRQIGVSPWYWWADVPVPKHENLYFIPGEYTDGEPAVRYRGIFLNDEAPCLTGWVKNTWGTDFGGHEFYARVFELLLRLKGNFMWPAMWGWSFYADDELNSKTADEMGIIMGTSHHEPMARNHHEYARNRQKWGAWDYVTNKDGLDRFFREGMERAKNTEDLITIGMRGDGDTSMGGKEGHDDETLSEDERVMRILKDVIDNQRNIISSVTGRPAEERPQVWALYKEVQKYYDKGLRVPDDVTILLSDDNWGDVRSLPTEEELKRKGGWGLYYHVDYVGAPRNTKWLNITPAANMWEQLQLTYSYGVNKLWVLNVGDLKPMEFPITMFLDFAWNPDKVAAYPQPAAENQTARLELMPYMEQWCVEQFGEREAKEAARILNLYTWYNGRVTPEMLDARTYDIASGEWKKVRDDYANLADAAVRQYERMSPEYKDAYYQLIYYPTVAMANLYDMYYSAATGDAERVRLTFSKDKELSDYYNHTMSGGKWNGMMTQKHIGYRTWNDNFPQDTPPRVASGALGTMGSGEASGKACIIEAEDFSKAECQVKGAYWTVIPFLGRTRSGVCVMPYTADPKGARLTYDIKGDVPDEATVYVITKSNLAFKNKAGHCFRIGFEGKPSKIVNTNRDINEDHPYDRLYPTVASRIIENKVVIPGARNGRLVIEPLDPGIVFEKIIVDFGGYRKTFLYGGL
ncbi:MAG: glycosyl hydrolase 115 family protein [Bacteroidaceae bacterium]|nr:glycosyl hydrolase 115 family protein [Bacteroidaceae bacterium]